MEEEKIKQAFQCVKQEINELKQQVSELKQQVIQLKTPTILIQNPTQIPFPTDTPTHIPTHQQPLEPLKPLNLPFSTGNRGVPTDKQTNQQTNRQTDNVITNTQNNTNLGNLGDFERANEILESLDSIKKEIRLKFKRLTPQEMLIFSTLYSLEEQKIPEITYKLISNNLNLSQSSIRDYIHKLVNKGIPILKIRQNNKKITLCISDELKKIANLSTINKLRDL